jgi:hypothetical protein
VYSPFIFAKTCGMRKRKLMEESILRVEAKT